MPGLKASALTPSAAPNDSTTAGTSRFTEHGSGPPYAHTTGSGDALVLRDGEAFQARWSRPAPDGGTTVSTVSGQPMTFAPGSVWTLLAAADAGR